MVGPEAQPVPARPASCAQPGPAADDLHPATVKSAWKRVATDTGRGSLDHLAVGADGTVWATRTTRRTVAGAVETRFDGLRRWDGKRWTAFPLPNVQVTALGAASAQQAWVFGLAAGQPGLVGSFQQGVWAPLQLAGQLATSIGTAGTATRAGWTVNGTTALHWNGSTWQYYELPAPAGAVGGEGSAVWTVSGPIVPPGPAARWDGTAWQQVGVPRLAVPTKSDSPRPRLTGVVVLGPRDVWAVGGVSWLVPGRSSAQGEPLERRRPVALHWDGTSWRCLWGRLGTTFTQAEPDGRGGMWVLDSTASRLLHLSRAGRWTAHPIPGTITALAHGAAHTYAAASTPHPTLWRAS